MCDGTSDLVDLGIDISDFQTEMARRDEEDVSDLLEDSDDDNDNDENSDLDKLQQHLEQLNSHEQIVRGHRNESDAEKNYESRYESATEDSPLKILIEIEKSFSIRQIADEMVNSVLDKLDYGRKTWVCQPGSVLFSTLGASRQDEQVEEPMVMIPGDSELSSFCDNNFDVQSRKDHELSEYIEEKPDVSLISSRVRRKSCFKPCSVNLERLSLSQADWDFTQKYLLKSGDGISSKKRKIKKTENKRSKIKNILRSREKIEKLRSGKKLVKSKIASQQKQKNKRLNRCFNCDNCNTADCKKCLHCKDMKKYGGKGLKKQSCMSRPPCSKSSAKQQRARLSSAGENPELLGNINVKVEDEAPEEKVQAVFVVVEPTDEEREVQPESIGPDPDVSHLEETTIVDEDITLNTWSSSVIPEEKEIKRIMHLNRKDSFKDEVNLEKQKDEVDDVSRRLFAVNNEVTNEIPSKSKERRNKVRQIKERFKQQEEELEKRESPMKSFVITDKSITDKPKNTRERKRKVKEIKQAFKQQEEALRSAKVKKKLSKEELLFGFHI